MYILLTFLWVFYVFCDEVEIIHVLCCTDKVAWVMLYYIMYKIVVQRSFRFDFFHFFVFFSGSSPQFFYSINLYNWKLVPFDVPCWELSNKVLHAYVCMSSFLLVFLQFNVIFPFNLWSLLTLNRSGDSSFNRRTLLSLKNRSNYGLLDYI